VKFEQDKFRRQQMSCFEEVVRCQFRKIGKSQAVKAFFCESRVVGTSRYAKAVACEVLKVESPYLAKVADYKSYVIGSSYNEDLVLCLLPSERNLKSYNKLSLMLGSASY
jgi:hypothetical protein